MTDMRNRPDLAAALAVTSAYPVFPLAGKMPAISSERFRIPRGKGGVKMAARDAERVAELWGMAAECRPGDSFNIGVATGRDSDLIVIDYDRHKVPPEELDDYDALIRELTGAQNTRVHHTQSGGTHYVYRLPEKAPPVSNKPIAPYIDIRADAGYVVWPPSAGYKVARDDEPARMTDALLQTILKMQRNYRAKSGGNGRPVEQLTLDELTDAVLAGANLHDNLFQLARRCAAEGMGKADTVSLMRKTMMRSKRRLEDPDAWHERLRDLERTADDAYARSGQSWDDAVETLLTGLSAADMGARPLIGAAPARSGGATGFSDRDKGGTGSVILSTETLHSTQLDPISWIVPNLIPERNLISITGPSGVGKTRLTAALVVALAAGKTGLLGLPEASRPARVAWYGNEEKTSDLLRRAKGAAQVLGDDARQQEAAMLFRGKDAAGGPLRLLLPDGSQNTKVLDALCAQLAAFKADVAIFDPMISLGVEDENASASVAQLMGAMLQIINKAGCSVMFVHHSPKDRTAPPDALRGDYAAWRGSGAIYSTLDVGLTLMPWVPLSVSGKDALRRYQKQIRDGVLPRIVALDMAKQREGQDVPSSLWEIVNHDLGNGQGDVGVMRRLTEEAAEKMVVNASIEEAAENIRKASEGARALKDEGEIRVMASALSKMISEPAGTLPHLRAPDFIKADVLPEGSRIERGKGIELLRAFRGFVDAGDGSEVMLRKQPNGMQKLVKRLCNHTLTVDAHHRGGE